MVLKVLLLNGPPRSGKDTLAMSLLEQSVVFGGVKPVFVEKFAAPIKQHFADSWGVSLEWIEWNKDNVFMYGVTVRQMLIAYSEKYMKPLFGGGIFGKMMVSRLAEIEEHYSEPPTVVISDSGFAAEAREVIEAGHEVHLIRLHRSGFDFKGDSRGYLNGEDLRGIGDIHDIFADDVGALNRQASFIYNNFIHIQ